MKTKKIAVIALLCVIGAGYEVSELKQAHDDAVGEYCASVIAGVHQDSNGWCPAGSFNTYRGLPGDVACVGDGTCTGGQAGEDD